MDLPLAVEWLGWPHFFQLLVNGLTLGSLYALIALGYSMVYGILKLLNFAHGDVYMVGAFIGFGVLSAFGGPLDPSLPALWLLLTLMFVAAMGGCGMLGVAIERFAYRPLREAPRIAPLISALGVSFFLQNSMLLLFGAEFRDYATFDLGGNPDIGEPGPLFDPVVTIGTLTVSLVRVIVIASAVVLMVALTLFVARTRLGKAMRATAYEREDAAELGNDV